MSCVHEPPRCHQVEGRSGVARLEACLDALSSRAMLVVVITSPDGLEGELGPVSESKLWGHGSVLVVASEVRVWCMEVHEKPPLLLG